MENCSFTAVFIIYAFRYIEFERKNINFNSSSKRTRILFSFNKFKFCKHLVTFPTLKQVFRDNNKISCSNRFGKIFGKIQQSF